MKDQLGFGSAGLAAGLIAFFSPIALLFYVMIALVIFDFLTKISAIIKKHKGCSVKTKLTRIKSYLAKFTPLKAFFYCIFIGIIYAMEIAVFGKSVYITNVLALLFYLTELYSIAENLDFCFGTNIFVVAVKKIRKLFEAKASKIISDTKIDDINNEVPSENNNESLINKT